MRTYTKRFLLLTGIICLYCINPGAVAGSAPDSSRASDHKQTAPAEAAQSGDCASRIGFTDNAMPVKSTGQPSNHRFQCGLVSGYGWEEDHWASRLFLNDHIQLSVPQVGAVKFTAELGLQTGRDAVGGTTALYGELFGVQNGIEYDAHRRKFLYRLAMNIVAKRGGLAHRGDRFRVEYVPATKTLLFGITISAPWARYRHNRPPLDHVRLTPISFKRRIPIDSTLYPQRLTRQAVAAMHEIDELLSPRLVYDIDSHRQVKKFDRRVSRLQSSLADQPRALAHVDSVYHQTVANAFRLAAHGDSALGSRLSMEAKHILLHSLIFPINRLFG